MNGLIRRTAIAVVATATALVSATGIASAHLTIDAPNAKQGASAVLTFKVSSESETANTTKLTVELPGLKTARTEPMAGWTSVVERDAAKMATSVTWTADAGGGAGPGQFQRFVLSAGPLPKEEKVSFRAVQTYSDGKVETWDQTTPAGGAEPKFPLPVLTLEAGDSSDGHGHPQEVEKVAAVTDIDKSDNVARWLGGVGLLLGILGAAAGFGALLRRRQS